MKMNPVEKQIGFSFRVVIEFLFRFILFLSFRFLAIIDYQLEGLFYRIISFRVSQSWNWNGQFIRLMP